MAAPGHSSGTLVTGETHATRPVNIPQVGKRSGSGTLPVHFQENQADTDTDRPTDRLPRQHSDHPDGSQDPTLVRKRTPFLSFALALSSHVSKDESRCCPGNQDCVGEGIVGISV